MQVKTACVAPNVGRTKTYINWQVNIQRSNRTGAHHKGRYQVGSFDSVFVITNDYTRVWHIPESQLRRAVVNGSQEEDFYIKGVTLGSAEKGRPYNGWAAKYEKAPLQFGIHEETLTAVNDSNLKVEDLIEEPVNEQMRFI